jgi:hypothetical protein
MGHTIAKEFSFPFFLFQKDKYVYAFGLLSSWKCRAQGCKLSTREFDLEKGEKK